MILMNLDEEEESDQDKMIYYFYDSIDYLKYFIFHFVGI